MAGIILLLNLHKRLLKEDVYALIELWRLYAIQLVKLGNVHVTATCGAWNIDLVKSLGADKVLDYKTLDGAALKSPSGRKYDAVVHCATGFPWSTFEPNLSENGEVIDITPSPSAMMTFALKKLTFCKKQLVPLLMIPKANNLEYLVGLVKEGKLKTLMDSKHPLSKAEDAWAKSIDGHDTRKIIVEHTRNYYVFVFYSTVVLWIKHCLFLCRRRI